MRDKIKTSVVLPLFKSINDNVITASFNTIITGKNRYEGSESKIGFASDKPCSNPINVVIISNNAVLANDKKVIEKI